MFSETYQDFRSFLQTEKDAIIAADFDRIDQLAAKKTNLFTDLYLRALSKTELFNVQNMLQQNETLLRASATGVRNARNRIDTLKDVSAGLRIYDQSGQVEQIKNTNSGIDKQS